MAGVRELSGDELAALEDERDFLLRSLDDLEGEHAVGDVDEHDYATLRDDYTARAARVIRTIEQHQARVADPEPRAARWRRLAVAAGIVAFALLAGVLVAQAAGRRQAGETITGDIRETSRQQIDEANTLASQGKVPQAIALLDKVIDRSPDNVEAITYKGWAQYLSGQRAQGLSTLVSATQIDDGFPATHAFLAKIFVDLGRKDYAKAEIRKLDSLHPPAIILQLVEPLRQQLGLASPGSSTTAP
jgi:tetratricopeptide (TPR) repeat protein